MRTIRVGSRESRLAVTQAHIVMQAIEQANPEICTELVTMKTTGDKILNRTLEQVGGKGLFVKELDEALMDGRVDICVHSYKDMPLGDSGDLPVVAVSGREDPRDVLILPQGSPAGAAAPIGCSSLRRRFQLEALFPGRICEPVRGNVLTRLEKLDSGQFGGLVLAAAGIRRLRLWERVSRVFSVEEILPASCQGILAVQARAGEDTSYLKRFHDADAWDMSLAERAFIHRLDGGCTSPAAAYAQLNGADLLLSGLYVTDSGMLLKKQIYGDRKDAAGLGSRLAEQLLEDGRAYE